MLKVNFSEGDDGLAILLPVAEPIVKCPTAAEQKIPEKNKEHHNSFATGTFVPATSVQSHNLGITIEPCKYMSFALDAFPQYSVLCIRPLFTNKRALGRIGRWLTIF